jgi:hypothetical protein
MERPPRLKRNWLAILAWSAAVAGLNGILGAVTSLGGFETNPPWVAFAVGGAFLLLGTALGIAALLRVREANAASTVVVGPRDEANS